MCTEGHFRTNISPYNTLTLELEARTNHIFLSYAALSFFPLSREEEEEKKDLGSTIRPSVAHRLPTEKGRPDRGKRKL